MDYFVELRYIDRAVLRGKAQRLTGTLLLRDVGARILEGFGYETEYLKDWMLFMPFKYNSARRYRIPKMKYNVTKWSEYEAGLRQRGSVTFWLSDEALPPDMHRKERRAAVSLVILIWRLKHP